MASLFSVLLLYLLDLHFVLVIQLLQKSTVCELLVTWVLLYYRTSLLLLRYLLLNLALRLKEESLRTFC